MSRLLTHGTSAAVAQAALQHGLLTRAESGVASQWAAHPSHGGAVYLTDAYALYFALNTLREPKDGDRVGVVEVDTKYCTLLAPDEDALEQLGRIRGDGVGGDIGRRTRWYRQRLDRYTTDAHARESLAALGTCAHIGNVPARAVTRVALINPQLQAELCFEALDPTISLINYAIVGAKYRALTARIWQGGAGITILNNPFYGVRT